MFVTLKTPTIYSYVGPHTSYQRVHNSGQHFNGPPGLAVRSLRHPASKDQNGSHSQYPANADPSGHSPGINHPATQLTTAPNYVRLPQTET